MDDLAEVLKREENNTLLIGDENKQVTLKDFTQFEHAENYTVIKVTNVKILSLIGIENFHNIICLIVINSDLSEVDYKTFDQHVQQIQQYQDNKCLFITLDYIIFQHSNIPNIDIFKYCRYTQHVEITHCALQSLKCIAQMSMLNTLNIGYNNLTNLYDLCLSMMEFLMLKKLILAGNNGLIISRDDFINKFLYVLPQTVTYLSVVTDDNEIERYKNDITAIQNEPCKDHVITHQVIMHAYENLQQLYDRHNSGAQEVKKILQLNKEMYQKAQDLIEHNKKIKSIYDKNETIIANLEAEYKQMLDEFNIMKKSITDEVQHKLDVVRKE